MALLNRDDCGVSRGRHLRRCSIVLYILFAALAVSGAVFLIFYLKGCPAKDLKVLEIRNSVTGRVFRRWPIEEADEFAVEFIHSVNQSPVHETFVIEGELIRAVSVRFSSFGAGMQSDLEEGQKLSRDGDAMVISGFKSSFRELNYIVGTVSDHLLFINGETVSLRDLCGRNAHITIGIR